MQSMSSNHIVLFLFFISPAYPTPMSEKTIKSFNKIKDEDRNLVLFSSFALWMLSQVCFIVLLFSKFSTGNIFNESIIIPFVESQKCFKQSGMSPTDLIAVSIDCGGAGGNIWQFLKALHLFIFLFHSVIFMMSNVGEVACGVVGVADGDTGCVLRQQVAVIVVLVGRGVALVVYGNGLAGDLAQ